MTKREYKNPEYEITYFTSEDVVTSSSPWEVTGVDLGDLGDDDF